MYRISRQRASCPPLALARSPVGGAVVRVELFPDSLASRVAVDAFARLASVAQSACVASAVAAAAPRGGTSAMRGTSAAADAAVPEAWDAEAPEAWRPRSGVMPSRTSPCRPRMSQHV